MDDPINHVFDTFDTSSIIGIKTLEIYNILIKKSIIYPLQKTIISGNNIIIGVGGVYPPFAFIVFIGNLSNQKITLMSDGLLVDEKAESIYQLEICDEIVCNNSNNFEIIIKKGDDCKSSFYCYSCKEMNEWMEHLKAVKNYIYSNYNDCYTKDSILSHYRFDYLQMINPILSRNVFEILLNYIYQKI